MQVRNKETGEIETLRHGPATDAVTAGTHDFVNLDGGGDPKIVPEKKADHEGNPSLDAMTKDQLVALAKERNVTVASDATKADILAALKAGA